MSVVLLSGGSGGAKLARGLLDEVGDELTVIANTGDDIEIHGGHVSPDPDLITYWLADRIDDRGWGIAGDTFAVMDALRELGVEVWFNLGDRDLAVCLERRRLLAGGAGLTEALARLGRCLGLAARVLPMSEEPVRTEIRTGGGWVGVQDFLIRLAGAAPIEDVRFAGAADASPAPGVLAAIAGARAIILGPSNPIISIGPILAVPGIREAVAGAPAPVVAVSPIVGGRVLKGPTAAFLAWAGLDADAAGVAACYHGLIDGLVADEPAAGIPMLRTATRMDDPAARRRLARETLAFAGALAE
ncbi:MAG: 2-phospho-L-lactate transferase [Solirubrobacteraceae bacterium]|nr:2-phospho-L-lactate transferase [Solirubrobacteraceae bacterium]